MYPHAINTFLLILKGPLSAKAEPCSDAKTFFMLRCMRKNKKISRFGMSGYFIAFLKILNMFLRVWTSITLPMQAIMAKISVDDSFCTR